MHGLTGTPTEMRFVARGLHEAGFTVHAVQLAGHCGTSADLVATGWRDWYASVEQAARALRAEVDHLFVAGLSMGAVLALELAIRRPREVDGARPLRHDLSLRRLGRAGAGAPVVPAAGASARSASVATAMFMESFPYGIKNERIRNWIVGSMLAGDSGASGLAGNPWPSLAEFARLSRHVRRRLGEVRAPCLVVHSSRRRHREPAQRRAARAAHPAPIEKVLLDDSYHMVSVDQQRDVLIERSAAFFGRIAHSPSPTRIAPATLHPLVYRLVRARPRLFIAFAAAMLLAWLLPYSLARQPVTRC